MPQNQALFLYSKKVKTVFRSRKDSSVWGSSLNAFVCFTLFAFSVAPNKQTWRSAVASTVKLLSKPWAYLSDPESQQYIRVDRRTKMWNLNLNLQDSQDPIGLYCVLNLQGQTFREHEKRTSCNSKVFAQISQSSPFLDKLPLGRKGPRPSTSSVELLLPPFAVLNSHEQRLGLVFYLCQLNCAGKEFPLRL